MTAPITHADALEALERALEVAPEIKWGADNCEPRTATDRKVFGNYTVVHDGSKEVALIRGDWTDPEVLPFVAQQVVTALAVVRVSLLGAKAALEQHRPVDVYEMPDESVDSLIQRIEDGTAVLAFHVCEWCAPQEVLDRIEDGELDLADGDASDAQWPCPDARRALDVAAAAGGAL